MCVPNSQDMLRTCAGDEGTEVALRAADVDQSNPGVALINVGHWLHTAVNWFRPAGASASHGGAFSGQVIVKAYNLAPGGMFRLILSLYGSAAGAAQSRSGRLPCVSELLWCSPSTSARELDLFFRRAKKFPRRHWALLRVERLTSRLREKVLSFQLELHEKQQRERDEARAAAEAAVGPAPNGDGSSYARHSSVPNVAFVFTEVCGLSGMTWVPTKLYTDSTTPSSQGSADAGAGSGAAPSGRAFADLWATDEVLSPDDVAHRLAMLVPPELRSINATYVHGDVGCGKTFFIERSLDPRCAAVAAAAVSSTRSVRSPAI